ncbi:type IV conjugative transfer system protein TraL [Chromobacterium sp. IIBBL 290-4]|uniref:type IV conjugative transfer system protein TraL n=1 Tax=Chromobacterium sp. IIBBL 290-4 TaxID=2953890 RepID=UPI0020B6715D|nr:type IV conjugative transfer system protein TraL [Chromobacterium sp. IIBBL 290-4]UTH74243.1 type IV conjugative transfer system protein TraL [Chromobacterium sp. IIBBL 290-4]
MEEVAIPNYVDRPVQFFFWEIDEVAPLFLLMGVGILTDSMTYLMPPALFFTWRFSRFKLAHLNGLLMHMAYSAGLLDLNKRFPYGTIKEYHE